MEKKTNDFVHPYLKEKIKFDGNVLIVGFGSVAQGVLPLLLRHLDISTKKIKILTGDERGKSVAEKYEVTFIVKPLLKDNYIKLLDTYLEKGDFLLNLSVDVSSIALIEYVQNKGCLYLDTSIEPWSGGYTDPESTAQGRSNYNLREQALKFQGKGKSTTLITNGANPGLISHFVKQALLNIAKDTGFEVKKPTTRDGWAKLAKDLNIKVIHVAERDTQVSDIKKKEDEFVNTWSIDGFVGEGLQPAELGWGSHEKQLPKEGRKHGFGRDSAIYLERPGLNTRVRSWTPYCGQQVGFLITHGESISLSDFLTVKEEDKVVFRPTVHYAYHPCNDAILSLHELIGRGFNMQSKQRLLGDSVSEGEDYLGALLMGHKKESYWFGSILNVKEARSIVDHNSATTLQITSSVLAGMIFAIENPELGVVEPEDMDYERALEICYPYLGDVKGFYTDWNPLKNRIILFEEDLDKQDPWQFKNFLVN